MAQIKAKKRLSYDYWRLRLSYRDDIVENFTCKTALKFYTVVFSLVRKTLQKNRTPPTLAIYGSFYEHSFILNRFPSNS